MMNFVRGTIESTLVFLLLLYIEQFATNAFQNVEKEYYLVSEAFSVAHGLFLKSRNNYDMLKNKSLDAIDTFLDLVHIMNNEMALELRSAIIKFYKLKYFNDFTNYVISMEEMIDIVEHCLIEPVEKLEQIRSQFHNIIRNFGDARNFDTINKCRDELPDEVASAHCILHQAVLSNETMQENLVRIVEIKTKQHAQGMNESLYNVQQCLNNFVPKFFEQLLVDVYTDKCQYLKVVNASITDLINDKWRNNKNMFPEKWSPFVKMLRERIKDLQEILREPCFASLLSLLPKNHATS